MMTSDLLAVLMASRLRTGPQLIRFFGSRWQEPMDHLKMLGVVRDGWINGKHAFIVRYWTGREFGPARRRSGHRRR